MGRYIEDVQGYKRENERMVLKIRELEQGMKEREERLEEVEARAEREALDNRRKLKQAKSARDEALLSLKEK